MWLANPIPSDFVNPSIFLDFPFLMIGVSIYKLHLLTRLNQFTPLSFTPGPPQTSTTPWLRTITHSFALKLSKQFVRSSQNIFLSSATFSLPEPYAVTSNHFPSQTFTLTASTLNLARLSQFHPTLSSPLTLHPTLSSPFTLSSYP